MKEASITTFSKAVAASMSSVLSQALGSEWQVRTESPQEKQASDQQDSPAGEVMLFITATGGLEGTFLITLARTDAQHLAAIFMGAGESEEQWGSETQEAVEELFRQIMGELATQLKPTFGPVTLRVSSDAVDCVSAVEIELCATSGTRLVPVTLQVSKSLIDSLGRPSAEAMTQVEGLQGGPRAERNLDLLMDVELGATLRFGRKVMPLRNILELASGSVIELDRQVHEPVDLLLEGKLVARGEVVIVDGNYGLRVTEVAACNQSQGVRH